MPHTLHLPPETEALAEKLAKAKGRPVAVVVREAIEASAREAGISIAQTRAFNPAEKLRRMREISDRSAARPVLDPRTPDDIIGYDDQGLPL